MSEQPQTPISIFRQRALLLALVACVLRCSLSIFRDSSVCHQAASSLAIALVVQRWGAC